MALRMLTGREPKHGTITGYFNDGCRCAECREAQRVYSLAYRARLRADRAASRRERG